ncbi:hypothetical protein GCM10022247_12600 [Allokutzneria multivorans]|uniref:Secreted protein n=1 Tax=Allokutzneria multivorans TaxID=1142134 RepID=A0ABP7R989_9PSEU
MRRNIRIAVAIVAAVAAGTTTTATASATPAPQDPDCGYVADEDGSAYYHHCGSGKVLVHIDYKTWNDVDWCLLPGWTPLGRASIVQNAWYMRGC